MNKKKFIIYSGGNWSPSVGGNIFLHKLCHDINTLGETAFITNKITHPKLNAPYYGDVNDFNVNDYIIIYPNLSNALNAKKNIVRLLLHPNKSKELHNYNANDLIITTYINNNRLPYLHTNFIDYSIFNKNDTLKRNGSAYMIKKGRIWQQVHERDSILLDAYTNDLEKIANVFKQIKTFYCYDNFSFWPILAALCGCMAIVIPEIDRCNFKQKYTSEQWRQHYTHHYCGIAYGTSILELEYAEKTLHTLYPTLQVVEQNNLETVKSFINLCDSNYNK